MRCVSEQYGHQNSVLSLRAAKLSSSMFMPVSTAFPVTGQRNFSRGMGQPLRHNRVNGGEPYHPKLANHTVLGGYLQAGERAAHAKGIVADRRDATG